MLGFIKCFTIAVTLYVYGLCGIAVCNLQLAIGVIYLIIKQNKGGVNKKGLLFSEMSIIIEALI